MKSLKLLSLCIISLSLIILINIVSFLFKNLELDLKETLKPQKQYVLMRRKSNFKSATNDSHSFSTNNLVAENRELKETRKELTNVLKPCNRPNLVGNLTLNFDQMKATYYELTQLYNQSQNLLFQPDNCKADQTIAIIIPFRDREQHLQYLLGHLHPFLNKQETRYQIFVVEQAGNYTFNKGRLMNTAFIYAKKLFGAYFDCYIFHDVDILPENDKNIYKCEYSNATQHLACSFNELDYEPMCCGLNVGGVLSFTGDQFETVNGYPNRYWGWGGEDDDMHARILKKDLEIKRPSYDLCRYHMIKHGRDKLNPTNPKVFTLGLNLKKAYVDLDGLNNVKTTILDVQKKPLYFHLMVDVGTA